MKGFVFTNFLDFVEQSFGLEMVDEMITNSNLKSEGVYTAFNSYEFGELQSMLTYVCSKSGLKPEVALEEFGKFVFPYLIGKHSYIIENYKDPLALIAGIENHIHIEVKKLYEDAELPVFTLVEKTDKQLIIIYQSKRGLTYFAIGLMKQTLKHFKVKGIVTIDENFNPINGNAVKFTVTLED